MCDHCQNRKYTKKIDVARYGKQISQILEHADSMQQKMTGKFVSFDFVCFSKAADFQ